MLPEGLLARSASLLTVWLLLAGHAPLLTIWRLLAGHATLLPIRLLAWLLTELARCLAWPGSTCLLSVWLLAGLCCHTALSALSALLCRKHRSEAHVAGVVDSRYL